MAKENRNRKHGPAGQVRDGNKNASGGQAGYGSKNRAGEQDRFGSKRAAEAYRAEDALEGKIEGNNKGFGFFVRDDGGEDLFVPARDMGGAMHGDRVRAVVSGHSRGAGEARVVEVLERGSDKLVGTFDGSAGGGFVVPDDHHFCKDIHVSGDKTGGAKTGDKVVVKVLAYPDGRKPEGRIDEVLGRPDDVGVDVLSIIRSYNLYQEFPKGVLKEACDIAQEVDPAVVKLRKDYRDEPIITIDGDDSKDFDDAVTLSRREGGWRLGVHIADVSAYVGAGTRLDKEALKRATSVYFVDRVLPMLPQELSNGICSLNEGEDRLTLSVIMYLDETGTVTKHKIREGVIRSAARMTYSKVAAILDGDAELRARYSQLVPMLEDMRTVADLLNRRRTERGNIEFDIPESVIELDEKTGRVKNIAKKPRLVSHKIVEEFMLLTNETVAEHFVGLKCPFVYRAHAVPPSEKVDTLVNFLSALGIAFRGDVNRPEPRDFSRLLAEVSQKDPKIAPVVNRVSLRSMSKATYEPSNIGHFGLAAPYYCHFTSPIRRYPDLMIHRIIKDYLHGGDKAFKKYEGIVDEVCKISSERERLAEQAERKVDDLKKAEYMRDKIGGKYRGVISGVTEWGLFVELDNSVEGLVRTETLPGDGYVYNPALFRLDSPERTFRLGDELDIVVAGVTGDRVSFAPDETDAAETDEKSLPENA